jgi:hypothetical protein
MIDPLALLTAYRAACIAADIDPATGPQSAYQVINARSAARRLARQRSAWWQAVEWGEPGRCRSETEYIALYFVDAAARRWRHRSAHRRHPNHDRTLRQLVQSRTTHT